MLQGWRALQAATHHATGADDPDNMFADATGEPIPLTVSQAFDRIARQAGVPIICPARAAPHPHPRHLLIEAGVPVKVVSERLGHASHTFTIETYQHVLPGMQSKAATTFEQLIAPEVPPANPQTKPAGTPGCQAPVPV